MSALLVFTYLVLSGMTFVVGAGLFKMADQRKRDKERIVYELTFPGDLAPEQVVAFLRSVSAPSRKKLNITGSHAEAWEIHADGNSKRIRGFIRVAPSKARGLVEQMHGSIPNMAVAEVQEPPSYDLTTAVEVGLQWPSMPLDIDSIQRVSTSILKSIDSLTAGEYVVIQHVLTAMHRQKKPVNGAGSHQVSLFGLKTNSANGDEIKARRDKLDEPNFQGVLRVGAKAKTDVAAKYLIQNVRNQFVATATGGNGWRNESKSPKKVISDMSQARTPALGGRIQYSITEMAAFLGWHMDGANIAGIPAGRAKMLPVPLGVQKEGRVFGVGLHPATSRQVAVSVKDSSVHWQIVGKTGSGKTTLAANLLAQDIHQGRGLMVIDPKQDLFEAALNYIPRNRLRDVVVFNAADMFNPVGFNLLNQGSPQQAASELQSIFDHIYRDTGAVRMPEVLYHVLITLMTTKAKGGPFTFVDIVPLLWPTSRQDQLFAKAVIGGVDDPYIKAWWDDKQKMSASERTKYFQSLRSRVWQLNARPDIRNIIGQSVSSIDLHDIVKNKKILLVNLKGLPEEVLQLVGSSLVNSLWHVLKSGYTNEENPFPLFLDEFHHFAHSPTPMDVMLAEGRSFGAQFHLMYQGNEQLAGRKELLSAVMGNTVNKVVMQRGSNDANTFAEEFGKPTTADDFKKLGKYEFYARVQSETGQSAPFIGKTLPPLEPYGYAKDAREFSRATYGRPLPEINADIETRRTAAAGSNKSNERPVVGDEVYDDEV